jgi:hypothetical protein
MLHIPLQEPFMDAIAATFQAKRKGSAKL